MKQRRSSKIKFKYKTKVVPCLEMGCTACCQWGDDVAHLKPDPTLLADKKGNCTHLILGKGCQLIDSELRPQACRDFDCRELLISMMDNPFVRIIIAAIRLQAHTVIAKTGKKETKH